MKNIEQYTGFEQGPIRPPSEASSMLLRLTRNCPWNQCTFCGLYKGTQFSIRPVEHVLQDIDTMRRAVALIKETQQNGERISYESFSGLTQDNTLQRQVAHAALAFVKSGMRSIFLQDGNSLIMPPNDLIRILKHVRNAFPNVDRITSYARSQSIAKISDEDLKCIADAGLNRIHIGMESGSDAVLKSVKKGVDKARQVIAGQKIKRAGMELSEYFMPGLGGKILSRDNALETAESLNQINPEFIRIRTLALPDSAPISTQADKGEFDKMGEVDTAKELLLFLDSLEGITSTIRSDHVLNLFTEVDGTLPHDKEKMTAPIRKFLKLSPTDQLIFCIGRRTHCLSTIDDLNNDEKRFHAKQTCSDMGATIDNMDAIIDSIIKRFI